MRQEKLDEGPGAARTGSASAWSARLHAGPRLADLLTGRDNNLNLLRVVAATSVLVSHAYPISLGPKTVQPLQAALGITLGGVAVAVFFVVSGMLVAQSWERSRTPLRFSLARVLRIFPGLAVVLLLTACVLGPTQTVLPIGEYASRFETWTYVPRNLLLISPQYPLPGVFDDQPYGDAINGSLWTLLHEVACYVALAGLGLAGAFKAPRLFAIGTGAWILLSAAILASGIIPAESRVTNFLELSPYFAVGIGAYLLREKIRLNGLLLFVACAAIAVARGSPVFRIVFAVALGYVVLVLAFLPAGRIRSYNRLGDYSYGIYIYAFPMQQLVAHWMPGIVPIQNMAFAFPLTLLLAILSWHGIEKRSLAWRDRAALLLNRWGVAA